MKTAIQALSLRLFILFSLNWGLAFTPMELPSAVPITAGTGVAERSTLAIPTLTDFVAKIQNGQTKQVVGVYVSKVLALKVSQQLANNPTNITQILGHVTQFGDAANFGTTALLAHNNRSGALFFKLVTGQEVNIIYGDGTVRAYVISSVRHFQSLRPTDPYSNFIDLDNGGEQLSSTNLFQQIYTGGDQVVFQTCISAYGDVSWGRLFVTAIPK